MDEIANCFISNSCELQKSVDPAESLGLNWDELSIVDYNPHWPMVYDAESKRLLKRFSPWLIN